MGRPFGDPVHDEVRPDVGAAIWCSVSVGKGTIFLFAVAKDRVFRALVVVLTDRFWLTLLSLL